jgi:hypothetical protein
VGKQEYGQSYHNQNESDIGAYSAKTTNMLSLFCKPLVLLGLKSYSVFIIRRSIFMIRKYRIMNFEHRIKIDARLPTESGFFSKLVLEKM